MGACCDPEEQRWGGRRVTCTVRWLRRSRCVASPPSDAVAGSAAAGHVQPHVLQRSDIRYYISSCGQSYAPRHKARAASGQA
jgi:hypothetical protein